MALFSANKWPCFQLTKTRTRTNVLACLQKDPEGCFVAEENDDVVGFIFSRTWGGVGWFGTFAVLPERQGHGIGQRLMAASLAYLRRDASRVIGLETMPASPYNLGLYLRQEFQARFPTLLLKKPLEDSTGAEVRLPRWSAADATTREGWLADLRAATARIQAGLDYSKEIISNARHGLGDTLVLTGGATAVGMSVVDLVSAGEDCGAERAAVRVLALDPEHTTGQSLHEVLGATETLARIHGKQVAALAVNARHPLAVERLLEWGYQVERTAVHMVLEGTDAGPSTDRWVDCSRWAG